MTTPRHVDELRSTLRSLGYLDAGVDRFVLAPAREGRGSIGIAFRSSLRIGLLIAGLLGPAAAVGVALRLPGLIVGPRDVVVVALYLAVLFGAAAAIGAFAAALAASSITRHLGSGPGFQRRAGRAAALAGFIVGLGCLTYLTLWWRAAEAGAGGPSLIWTIFALAVAAAISLLVGHVVTATATAVIARSGGSAAFQVPQTRHSWRYSAALGVVAFAGATVLLASIAPAESLGARARASDAAAPLAVVPTGLRITLIAIDGFDVGLYARVASDEATPNFKVALGGSVATIAPDNDRDPARSWTSLATGQPPDAHGIQSLETRRVPGLQGSVASERSSLASAIAATTDLLRLSRPSVATDMERREKTFWEIAGEAGFRTAVVNWWATWPAPPAGGIVITDRATLRLEHGGPLDAEIAPPSLYADLKRAWPELRGSADDQARRAFENLPDEIGTILRRSAALDALQVELATHPVMGTPDLLAVYLPGLDIAQYALLGHGDGLDVSPSALAERVEALQRYYGFLDMLLGKMVSGLDDKRVVALVTRPGRIASQSESLFAVNGGPSRAGGQLRATSADIAPTLMTALGLPASRDMRGRPLMTMFEPEFEHRYAVRWVETYGGRTTRRVERGEEALDEEMIERLRTLGYLR